MSAAETSGRGRANVWTEPEKYSFLLQIVQQLGGEKFSIKFDQLAMPGRTPKSMAHMWLKIKNEWQAAAAGDATTTVAGPAPKTGGKTKAVDDGENGTALKKRRAPAKKRAAKKDDNDENEAAMTKLKSSFGEHGQEFDQGEDICEEV